MYNLSQFVQTEAFAIYKKKLKEGSFFPVLRDVKIKLTPRCNLRCQYCYYWRMPREEELTLEEVEALFAQLKELGCLKIHFSGGEIFLREDTLEILQRARAYKFKVCLTTNGTLLTKPIAKALVKMRVSSVAFSLDSADPKVHDRQRGVKGSFRKTLKAIAYLASANEKYQGRTRIRINMVLTRKNYAQLPSLLKLAKEMGVNELLPMPVDEKGRKKVKHRLSKKHIQDYNQNIAPAVLALRKEAGFSLDTPYVYPFGRTKKEIACAKEGKYAQGFFEKHPCHAPFLHMFIGWNGDVSICCMLQNKLSPLGNVRHNTLKEIFWGEAYQKFRELFLKERLSDCHRCDNFLRENLFLQKALEKKEETQSLLPLP